ncbi:hypothetical protein KIN20_004013 [Parelaphostrongylus tenuis]|uniref:DNAJC9 HTH domain-containing protein n=1 Tax=Parelaphostrongylus tenuis TaxID=148309 RepID=A0AAD5MJ50_PARTN|nr:hypothetical protein KIN20_004013 [Parelaphostrongylus tenuis]
MNIQSVRPGGSETEGTIKAYEILSDKERRALYDESGIIDKENLSSDSINLFQRVFKKVTVEDIEKFHNQYKGSEEEESDIVTAYNSWKGDMSKIIDSVYCATIDDEDRIRGIIDRNISSGLLKKTARYQASTSAAASAKRKRKAMKEAEEAEALLEEIRAKEGAGSLEQIIQQRQLARSSDADAFVDSLAAKYGAKKKRAKK